MAGPDCSVQMHPWANGEGMNLFMTNHGLPGQPPLLCGSMPWEYWDVLLEALKHATKPG